MITRHGLFALISDLSPFNLGGKTRVCLGLQRRQGIEKVNERKYPCVSV